MVVEKLFVQDLQKVSGHSEKKICAAGVTKILTEAPTLMTDYQVLWYVHLNVSYIHLNQEMRTKSLYESYLGLDHRFKASVCFTTAVALWLEHPPQMWEIASNQRC